MNAPIPNPTLANAVPSWAANREALALIQAILAEQPALRITVDEYGVEHHSYFGKAAAKLRGLHDRALTLATEEANARYAEVSWDRGWGGRVTKTV